ncbi:hypothetical protein REPUB_Repub02eG0240700 [Reevesia pubescens]
MENVWHLLNLLNIAQSTCVLADAHALPQGEENMQLAVTISLTKVLLIGSLVKRDWIVKNGLKIVDRRY